MTNGADAIVEIAGLSIATLGGKRVIERSVDRDFGRRKPRSRRRIGVGQNHARPRAHGTHPQRPRPRGRNDLRRQGERAFSQRLIAEALPGENGIVAVAGPRSLAHAPHDGARVAVRIRPDGRRGRARLAWQGGPLGRQRAARPEAALAFRRAASTCGHRQGHRVESLACLYSTSPLPASTEPPPMRSWPPSRESAPNRE